MGVLLVAVIATTGNHRSAPACRLDQLRLANGVQVSGATGQNPLTFVLTNRGTDTCVLGGYPSVALVDARGVRLPFRISHRGDQMVTSRRPVPVRLAPRRSAFFMVNKYRCDRGDRGVARRLRLASRLVVTLPRHPVIGYCGQNGPGTWLTVSPYVARVGDALAHG